MLKTIDMNKIIKIILDSATEVMKIYNGDFSVEYKEDNSPLTKADLKANDIICKGLKSLHPNIPILSEENKQIEYKVRKDWEYYWCIDPIDGTKEFVKRNGEFTLNIALICNNTPVLGVVYAPVLRELYFAQKDQGAFVSTYDQNDIVQSTDKLPLKTNNDFTKSISIVASKSHMTEDTKSFIKSLQQNTQSIKMVSKGSSLKICMIAKGSAHIYPRIAPTMEWDTAAAHAIVLESKKNIYYYDKTIDPFEYLINKDNLIPVNYNKLDLLNPNFVVV